MKPSWLLTLALLLPQAVHATEPTTDCVIDWQQSSWVLAVDGSARITEDLDVNCGSLTGKHGIYRIIPERVPAGSRPSSYRVATPIKLISVLNDKGQSYNYETSRENGNLKIKIGDADILISGRLHYQIVFEMQNVVWPDPTTGEAKIDLNVVGQFWQLPIDQAEISIKLPAAWTGDLPQLTRGGFGATDRAKTATVTQTAPDTLTITDTETFDPETGLTASFTAPATMFSLPNPEYSLWEKWGGLLWLLWPILIIGGALRVWRRWGKDIKLAKAHMVQYTPPKDLPPYEAYLLQHNGSGDSKALAGLIVGLAVKGYLQLERQKSGIFGKKVVFTCQKAIDSKLSKAEAEVMDGLFTPCQPGTIVASTSLKYGFQQAVASAQKGGLSFLKEKQWFESQTIKQWPWILLAVLGLVLSGMLFPLSGLLGWLGPLAALAALVGVIILMVLMPRKTEAGAEIEWQLRGFQDYLKTAEKYRLQFSEKENLFEKYLPYAVAFGVTVQWARAMRNLYGEEYWANYHPVWYVGTFDISDIDSFSTAINSVASDISSAMSSGTSGGSSGGGAGGGGGGSW